MHTLGKDKKTPYGSSGAGGASPLPFGYRRWL